MFNKLIIPLLIVMVSITSYLWIKYYYESSSYLISSTRQEIQALRDELVKNKQHRDSLVKIWDLLSNTSQSLYESAKDLDREALDLQLKISDFNERIGKLEFSFFGKAYATVEWDIKSVPTHVEWAITFKRIVIHHSASFIYNQYAVSELHKRRHQKCIDRWVCKHLNEGWDNNYIDYHYVITKTWDVIQTRPLTKEWWATKYNNSGTIHIMLVWNFQKYPPDHRQYRSLNNLISDLYKQFPMIENIIWHWQAEWESTACPGKMFDRNKIYISRHHLTRYYSPTPDQTKWLLFEKSKCRWCTSEQLYRKSVKTQFNGDNDITMPKDGKRYTDADSGNAAACPKDKLGKSFIILTENTKIKYRQYKCRDVWWAIKWNRIDIYAGIWDNAIDRWNDLPTGKQKLLWIE